jgi:D-aminopeptidase
VTGGRARARELGIVVGSLPPGPGNAITDVPGVLVGHTTLVSGDDIRTGVTAVVPEVLRGFQRLPAGLAVGNGFGKMVGTTQLRELGVLETPIVLTSTLAIFRAADAVLSYLRELPGNDQLGTVNPVAAETNDQYLSDIWQRPVTEQHVLAALRGASGGPVAEGAVGAGTGTGALGYKAGIGTASRTLTCAGQPRTIGALVQANFGGTLTVSGRSLPAGPTLRAAGVELSGGREEAGPERGDRGNSCVIVLATDAPLDARQLDRLARRAIFAMARTGSAYESGSGDYALAFATGPVTLARQPAGPAAAAAASGQRPAAQSRAVLADDELDPLFAAAMDCTEEAILNSLCMAQTTAGFRGHVRHAVPLDALRRR